MFQNNDVMTPDMLQKIIFNCPELEDCLVWVYEDYEIYRCTQCGKKMNPVARMLGEVCQECCDKNRAEVFGK